MTNVLRIRRRASGSPGAPASLWDSELAYNFVDDVLYLGKGTGGAGGTATSILAIAGIGAFVDKSTDQTIGGVKTFSSTIVGNINTANALSTGRTIGMTGDVVWTSASFTGAGNVTGTSTIQNDAVTTLKINNGAVTLAKMADLASARIVGRITAGSGVPESLTAADVLGMIGVTAGASVSSVGLSLPGIFSVSNSPVTGSGTLTATLANQNTNVVWAGPSSGGAAAPTFRSLVANDIPVLVAAKISDFDTQVRVSRLDQMAAPTADVALNSRKITGLADPTNAQDAATKAYVDATSQGLNIKPSVRLASTANLTLSGNQTIDGVATSTGDRILVKDQSTPADNGIYVTAAGAWTRAVDFDASSEALPGAFTFVSEGTANGNTSWVLTTDAPITLGTTSLSFTQFGAAAGYIAGAGLTLTGNTFDIVGTTNRIVINADSIDISANYVGQTSITTLGTIGTGTWQGTAVGMAYGGTGVSIAGFTDGTLLMKGSSGVTSAVAGTDYLSPSSTIDGGTF